MQKPMPSFWQRHLFISIVGGLLLVTIIAITTAFFLQSRNTIKEQMRNNLATMAGLAAQQFDATNINAIETTQEMHTAEFAKIVQKLQKIRQEIPTAQYAYIMRTSESQEEFEFVADADAIDPPHLEAALNGRIRLNPEAAKTGEVYSLNENVLLLQEGYTRAVVDAEINVNQWGAFLSAYAPIRDEDKNTVAILGIDIDAQKFISPTQGILSPMTPVLVFLIASVIAVYFGMINWLRYVEWEAMQALAFKNAELQNNLEERDRALDVSKENLSHEIDNSQKFQRAIESSVEGIAILSPELQFVYINPAWKKITGYDLEDLDDTTLELLMSDQMDVSLYAQLLQSAALGEPFTSDAFKFQRKDETSYDAEVLLYAIKSPDEEVELNVVIQHVLS